MTGTTSQHPGGLVAAQDEALTRLVSVTAHAQAEHPELLPLVETIAIIAQQGQPIFRARCSVLVQPARSVIGTATDLEAAAVRGWREIHPARAAQVEHRGRARPGGGELGRRCHVRNDLAQRRGEWCQFGKQPHGPDAGGDEDAVSTMNGAVAGVQAGGRGVDIGHRRVALQRDTTRRQPSRQVVHDTVGIEDTTTGVVQAEAGIFGMQHREARGQVARRNVFVGYPKRVQRRGGAVGPVPLGDGKRQTTDAPYIVSLRCAGEVLPKPVPRRPTRCHHARIATLAAVGRSDQPMLVIRRALAVRDGFAFEHFHPMPRAYQRPGRAQAIDPGSNDQDMHRITSLSGSGG